MKTQITLENKVKFFAQYFGQEVLSDGILFNNLELDAIRLSSLSKIEDYCLTLKSIDSISEEDYRVLARHHYADADSTEYVRCWYKMYQKDQYIQSMLSVSVDYLRLKGYAVPWNGMSVDMMITFGWVQFTKDIKN